MKKKSGIGYFLLSFIVFVGLGLEVLVGLVFEPLIYGAQINDWTTAQNISHWIITCILWGIMSAVTIHIAKKSFGFDLFKKGSKIQLWQWILILLIVIANLVISYLDWNGFKVIKEFNYNGWLKFIFQYIYYIFETLLVVLIIIFGQKAFENWFHKSNIPYGGIVLALTWGASHIFTKDLTTGFICMISGVAFGCIYLLTGRDFKKAFPILFIAFVL